MDSNKNKRLKDAGDNTKASKSKTKTVNTDVIAEETLEYNNLVFEDPFGDEFEEEQFDEEQNVEFNDDEDHEEEDGDNVKESSKSIPSNEAEEYDGPKQVWRPGVDQIAEGEELEYDSSAYIMYHSLQAEWPCLSFDIVRDNLGESRQRVSSRYFSIRQSLSFVYVNFSYEYLHTVPIDHVCGHGFSSR